VRICAPDVAGIGDCLRSDADAAPLGFSHGRVAAFQLLRDALYAKPAMGLATARRWCPGNGGYLASDGHAAGESTRHSTSTSLIRHAAHRLPLPASFFSSIPPSSVWLVDADDQTCQRMLGSPRLWSGNFAHPPLTPDLPGNVKLLNGEVALMLPLLDPQVRLALLNHVAVRLAEARPDELHAAGIPSEQLARLRQLSALDLNRLATMRDLSIGVVFDADGLSAGLRTVSLVNEAKALEAYFIRHGASWQMMSALFKIRRKVTLKRRRDCGAWRRSGRMPLPDTALRERICRAWMAIEDPEPRGALLPPASGVSQALHRRT
jgi:hypothetical protein